MKTVYAIILINILFASYRMQAQENYIFPYDLHNPDKVQKLPTKLYEISGISWLGDNKIASVQDEKGNIYIVDFQKGNVSEKIAFGEDGDYEDLTVINDTAWILKSNGDLYRIEHYNEGDSNIKTKKFNTPLKKNNDTEGLTYDPLNNCLLIACKGHPYISNDCEKHIRSVYEFDLNTCKMNIEPVIIIDLDSIKAFRNYNIITQWGIDLLSWFDKNKGDVYFQPSGIAIHPFTGNIYLIASVGDILIVIDRNNNIIHLADLDDALFMQPEGITFDESGNLYISNEGNDCPANILKFSVNN